MIDPNKEHKSILNFEQKKVMTIQELCSLLECSIPTMRKRLVKWKVYTSYNKNSRYYAMPGIPKFDNNGLWNYKGILFSYFGTLKKTVIQLIKNSIQGLSSSEIGILVGLNPRSFLFQFRDIPEIVREKKAGTYIYFSAKAKEYLCQNENREATISRKLQRLPSDSDAIAIFVDIIKHPETTIKESIRRLRRKGMIEKEETIMNLLNYHNITLKKTQDMSS